MSTSNINIRPSSSLFKMMVSCPCHIDIPCTNKREKGSVLHQRAAGNYGLQDRPGYFQVRVPLSRKPFSAVIFLRSTFTDFKSNHPTFDPASRQLQLIASFRAKSCTWLLQHVTYDDRNTILTVTLACPRVVAAPAVTKDVLATWDTVASAYQATGSTPKSYSTCCTQDSATNTESG